MSNMVIGDDGYLEILGEQTRGGSDEIVGELMQQSPAFNAYVQKRGGINLKRTPLQKARDWQVDFGPVSGAAATTTTITVQPQCLFRGEKVMATDTGSPAGTGTRVQNILIGQKLQRPLGTGGTLTSFFANNSLGNGIKWDTCQPALSISVTVSFIQACTFDMTVFGKAVA